MGFRSFQKSTYVKFETPSFKKKKKELNISNKAAAIFNRDVTLLCIFMSTAICHSDMILLLPFVQREKLNQLWTVSTHSHTHI